MYFVLYKIEEVTILLCMIILVIVARGVILWYYEKFGVSINLLRLEFLCISYNEFLCYVLEILRQAWNADVCLNDLARINKAWPSQLWRLILDGIFYVLMSCKFDCIDIDFWDWCNRERLFLFFKKAGRFMCCIRICLLRQDSNLY